MSYITDFRKKDCIIVFDERIFVSPGDPGVKAIFYAVVFGSAKLQRDNVRIYDDVHFANLFVAYTNYCLLIAEYAMNEKNTKRLSIENIDGSTSMPLLKNYIISNNRKAPFYIQLNESFIFDGTILGVCIKGNGTIKMNHREYEIKPGTILSVFPDKISTMVKVSDDFLLELMFFSGDYISSFSLPVDKDVILSMNENPCIEVDDETMHNILELHSVIIKQHNEKLKYKDKIIKSLLLALMLKVASYYTPESGIIVHKESTREEELTKKFFDLLINNFRTEKNLSFYADKLCLTPNYLSSVIKKSTGSSIQEWIKNVIIMEAKNKLKTTDMTVLQISEELNFANPSFFGRFFKQYVGVTPFKYRNL